MHKAYRPACRPALTRSLAGLLAIALVWARAAWADDAPPLTEGEILKLIDNPVGDIYTIPVENNFGAAAGPNRVFSDTINLKPVIPFDLNDDWLLITRTIAPIIDRPSQKSGAPEAFGLGDIETSFYVSPTEILKGFDWGLGPVVHMPTATVGTLGGNEWGVGPAGAVGWQENGWTFALLMNQIWSPAKRANLSTMNIDPAISKSWHNGFGWKIEANSTYNWISRSWSIPLKAGVSQLFTIGGHKVSLGFDGMYYASRSSTDPEWALRLTVKFVIPR